MTARNALRFTAVLTAVFSIVLLVRPEWMLDLFDFSEAGDAAYWLRRYGVALAAFTIVLWSAAAYSSSMMQRPVLWAAGVLAASMLVLSLIAIIDSRVNALFWAVAAYEAVLTLWFGWLLAAERV